MRYAIYLAIGRQHASDPLGLTRRHGDAGQVHRVCVRVDDQHAVGVERDAVDFAVGPQHALVPLSHSVNVGNRDAADVGHVDTPERSQVGAQLLLEPSLRRRLGTQLAHHVHAVDEHMARLGDEHQRAVGRRAHMPKRWGPRHA